MARTRPVGPEQLNPLPETTAVPQTQELEEIPPGEIDPCVQTLGRPPAPVVPIDVSGTSGRSVRLLLQFWKKCKVTTPNRQP